jgi:CDP-glucose 4,6-dehydratase
MSNFSCFDGAKILITGHTGFKGSWLSLWLTKLGAQVYGVSQDIPTTPSLFTSIELEKKLKDYRFDICEKDLLNNLIGEIKPNFIFHLAAQSLVRPSYKDPLNTLKTNALGTAKVLDSLRLLDKPMVAVMITSDKVYDNVEWLWGYRETDRLGGKDPYSASKGMAELVIRSYVESYFNSPNSDVRIGIARAGNVIGGGDWATDRIVPDCINAWSVSKMVDIRNLHATRPWQHVMEPLSGYLSLGLRLYESNNLHGEAYNFGPPARQNYTVRKLINEMANYWDNVDRNDASH